MARKVRDTRGKERKAGKYLFARLVFVYGIIFMGCAFLVGAIIHLNVTRGDAYEKKVLSQQSYVSSVLPYKRGDIVDRNGNKLATSKKVYNLVLDPQLILSDEDFLEPTLDALDKVFDIDRDTVMQILEDKAESRYYVMDDYKELEIDAVEEFEALTDENRDIKGAWFEEEYLRTYPYSTVGSSVIGFCLTDNTGAWGIENSYNDSLNGTTGRKYGYYDSDLNLVETVKEASNGNTVVSTIDVNVQGILEQKMSKYQDETGSKNMGVIIMNPQNGEIYAMASYPFFDLNNPRDLTVMFSEDKIQKMSDEKQLEALNRLWRNFCISDAYEPGSTFKPITVAACLDENVAFDGQHFNCDGGQDVSGTYIRCVANSWGGHGSLTLCGALMESCNDVMMQLGAQMGKNTFLRYVRDFGFGKKTGLDLPGESTGTIFSNDTMHSVELATSSFGQGQTVTMIQMAAAISAVVNGGSYYEPHVVKEVDSESGTLVSSNDDTMIKKVITEDTSELIRGYLYETVEDGTANPASVKGYSIGGKTGTAEKSPRGQGNYLVSFIGFTPVEDPEVLIYVVIDEPNVEDQAHSTYATEFASDVMKDVLPLLGVYKDSGSKKSKKNAASQVTLPSTKNGNFYQEAPEDGYADKDYDVAGDDEDTDTDEPDTEE